jgi:hypothetical protein
MGILIDNQPNSVKFLQEDASASTINPPLSDSIRPRPIYPVTPDPSAKGSRTLKKRTLTKKSSLEKTSIPVGSMPLQKFKVVRETETPSKNTPNTSINSEKKGYLERLSDLEQDSFVNSVECKKTMAKSTHLPFQNAVQKLATEMGRRSKSDCNLFDMHLISDCLSPYPSEVKQVVERWYGKLFFTMVQYLFNQFQLSEDYYILFLHPGVACRVEVVAKFLSKNPPPYESPVTLFEKFSEYLGSVELHRAVWMPDAYWEQCQNSDSAPTIISRAAWEHNSEAIANTFRELFQTEGDSFETVDPRLPKYNTIVDCFSFVTKTTQAFRKHEVAFERPSPFIPSSPYKEAAVRIAYTISKDVRKTLGVYSFQIPRIETITHTGPFCRADVVSCNIEYQLSGQKIESIPFVNSEYLVIGNIPSAAVTRIESPVYPSSLQTMDESRDRSSFAKPDFSIRKWA